MSRARFARWLLVIWALTGCASAAAPPGGQTGSTVTPADPPRPRVEVTTEAEPVPSAPAGPVGPEPVVPAGPLSSLSVGPAHPAEPSPVAPPALTAPGAPSPKVAQPPVPAPKVAAGQSAVQLKHVQVEQQADSVTVKLWTTGIPSYSASLIDAPTRLVIDLTGTAYAWDKSRVNPDVAPIREIRGSQWKVGTARIVLELTRKVGYRIEPSAEGLSIIFDSSATAVRADAPKPTASKPAPKAVAVVAKAETSQAAETPKTETPAVTPAGPPSAAAAPARRQIVFNFDNADVELVIQAAAEIVGFNYVLAPGVRGRTVTVKTLGKISADEVFGVLLTILDVNGLAAVRTGNLYRIIPREGAPQTSIKTVVGRDVDPAQPADEIVTQVVPLGFLGASDAVTLLRPLVPPGGTLGAHPESNLLIVTDTVANIRRLLDIVRLVDVEGAHSELRIIPLMHADAQELAQLLTQVFASGRLSTGLSGVGAGVPAPAPPPPPAPERRSAAGGPAAAACRRGNSTGERGALDSARTPLQLPRGPCAEKGHRDHPPAGREARRGHLRRPARLHLLRREHQGQGPRHDPRRHLRLRSGPLHHRRPADIAVAQHLQPVRHAHHHRSRRAVGSVPVTPVVAPVVVPVGSGAGRAAAHRQLPGSGRRRGRASRGRGPDHRRRGHQLDHRAHLPAALEGDRGDHQEARQDAAPGADRGPRRRGHAERRYKLGMEWAIRSGRFTAISSPSGTLPGRPDRALIPLGGIVPHGFSAFAFAADKFLAALNALASENKVNVLSNPSIMTAENKKAVINVSTSVPIVTSQQVPVATGGITGNSITQAVEYKDAGIILSVTPRIGEQGTVSLDVKQEFNQVGENEPPPINSPRFTKREVETSVVLLNNQTLVLGGLIQNRRSRIRLWHSLAEPHSGPGLSLRLGRAEARADGAADPDHPPRGGHRARRRAHHRRDAAYHARDGAVHPPGAAPALAGRGKTRRMLSSFGESCGPCAELTSRRRACEGTSGDRVGGTP